MYVVSPVGLGRWAKFFVQKVVKIVPAKMIFRKKSLTLSPK